MISGQNADANTHRQVITIARHCKFKTACPAATITMAEFLTGLSRRSTVVAAVALQWGAGYGAGVYLIHGAEGRVASLASRPEEAESLFSCNCRRKRCCPLPAYDIFLNVFFIRLDARFAVNQ